jgi:D-arabinose 1-dehydrogenase-like Zn-dependent alcohol dehydrogenase
MGGTRANLSISVFDPWESGVLHPQQLLTSKSPLQAVELPTPEVGANDLLLAVEACGFQYRLLWGERTVRSVMNLTRQDGIDFLALAPRIPIQTETQVFPLSKANEALNRLREGRIRGAAVLVPDSTLT